MQRALVGHEELVGGDALIGQGGELLERPSVVQVGDRDVVAHVDHLLAVGLRLPVGEGVAEARALRLDAEVDVAGRAAEGGRRLARLDVVDRDRSAEGHVEMRVRVDAAGQHVLAGCVDHLVCWVVERFADQGDPLAVDEHVGDIVVRRRDDAAILDQHGHSGSPFSVEC